MSYSGFNAGLRLDERTLSEAEVIEHKNGTRSVYFGDFGIYAGGPDDTPLPEMLRQLAQLIEDASEHGARPVFISLKAS
jgi:hypothetical protein